MSYTLTTSDWATAIPPPFSKPPSRFHFFIHGFSLPIPKGTTAGRRLCHKVCVCLQYLCVLKTSAVGLYSYPSPSHSPNSLEFWIEIGSKQLFFIHTLLWLTSKQRYVHMYIGSMNFVAKSEKFYETEIKKKESKSMQTKIPLYIIWTGNMAILSIKNSKLINTYSN